MAEDRKPATVEHVGTLAGQFVGFLRAPRMLRNSPKAALLLLYLQRDDMTDKLKKQFIADVVTMFGGVDHVEQRNITHGLSEVRAALGQREPSDRTNAAVSLWEQLIGKLPQDMQYLAREGEIE